MIHVMWRQAELALPERDSLMQRAAAVRNRKCCDELNTSIEKNCQETLRNQGCVYHTAAQTYNCHLELPVSDTHDWSGAC